MNKKNIYLLLLISVLSFGCIVTRGPMAPTPSAIDLMRTPTATVFSTPTPFVFELGKFVAQTQVSMTQTASWELETAIPPGCKYYIYGTTSYITNILLPDGRIHAMYIYGDDGRILDEAYLDDGDVHYQGNTMWRRNGPNIDLYLQSGNRHIQNTICS